MISIFCLKRAVIFIFAYALTAVGQLNASNQTSPRGVYKLPTAPTLCRATLAAVWRTLNRLEDATPKQILAMPPRETLLNEAGHFPPSHRISRPFEELQAIEGAIALLSVHTSAARNFDDSPKVFFYDHSRRSHRSKRSIALARLSNLFQKFGGGNPHGLVDLDPSYQMVLSVPGAERIQAFLKILPQEVARDNKMIWNESVRINQKQEDAIKRLTGRSNDPGEYALLIAAFMITNMAVSRITGNYHLTDPALLMKSGMAFGLLYAGWRVFLNRLIHFKVDARFPHAYKARARLKIQTQIKKASEFVSSKPKRGQFFFFEAVLPASQDPEGEKRISWFIRMGDDGIPILSIFLFDQERTNILQVGEF